MVCRMLHSPPCSQPHFRLVTSRRFKGDQHMLQVCITMRSGGSAASYQAINVDTR